ncbi:RidA family protein [Mesorhizobium ventifaucium]|uniref:RutC family protein YoaB n=1 Tax=Mesorhizobium ventifaucium TaxID=666020 RepID=A0ABM9DIX9_9HYPH|nr:RidA family protein [Mesorhizobium ventifaucium]CAH2396540.1 putative RutC family protein YoaB [Mesorhizobium ventifaucium]
MAIKRYESDAHMSRVVEANGMIFLTGVTAQDRSNNLKDQTAEVLSTIDQKLMLAGSDKSKVLSATCYLSDKSKEPEMNEAWEAWVQPGCQPARATVGATLGSPDTLVEIVLIAMK